MSEKKIQKNCRACRKARESKNSYIWFLIMISEKIRKIDWEISYSSCPALGGELLAEECDSIVSRSSFGRNILVWKEKRRMSQSQKWVAKNICILLSSDQKKPKPWQLLWFVLYSNKLEQIKTGSKSRNNNHKAKDWISPGNNRRYAARTQGERCLQTS